jgi:hypothetical protein
VQRDRLLADRARNGWYGTEIDELAPVPDGVLPLSYLIAAWINVAGTPAATTAARWMGEQDWTAAQRVYFPLGVIALFVSDIASMVDDAAAGASADGSSGDSLRIDLSPSEPHGLRGLASPAGLAASVGGLPGQVTVAPCSTAQSFIARSMAALVNALHIPAVSGGSVFARILDGLVTIVNVGVKLAAGVLSDLIQVITAKVFDSIRIAVAIIGVATIAPSYFTDQHLTVRVEPSASTREYRFAIGPEPDITGQFVATSPDLTGQWPPALKDCAQATGAALPQAVGAGSPANWAVSQAVPVIAAPPVERTVGADLIARLEFTTGREPPDNEHGEQRNGTAFAKVTVPRSEVQQMAAFARGMLDGALKDLANRLTLRIPGLRDAALSAFHGVVDPVIADVQRSIEGVGGRILAMQGTGIVAVNYHLPPEPTTVPTSPVTTVQPSPRRPDDACSLLTGAEVVAATGAPLSEIPPNPYSPFPTSCGWSLNVNSGEAGVTVSIVEGSALASLKQSFSTVAPAVAGVAWPAWGLTTTDDEITSTVFVDLGTWGLHLSIIRPADDDAGMTADLSTAVTLARQALT